MRMDTTELAGRRAIKRIKQKKRRRRRKRIIAILVLLAVVLGGGYVAAKSYLVHKLGNFDYVSLDGEDLDIDSRASQELEGYHNIVLLGVDSRVGEEDDNCRSDAIVIMSINEETNDVIMGSVLRDTYLNIESNGQNFLDKVTHAHAFGGPVNTIRALNRNLDLNIEDYVRVNWETVADLVDTVGGVEVNIKDYEVDEMNKYIIDTYRNLKKKTHLIKKTGKQTLDGTQAVTYCRIRKVGNGDEERSGRMRIVVKQLVSKARQMKITGLIDTVNKVMPLIQTSISPEEMFDMILKYKKYKLHNTRAFPYKYAGAQLSGIWYDVPVTLSKNVRFMHKVFFKQFNYSPTDRLMEISREIAAASGYWQ